MRGDSELFPELDDHRLEVLVFCLELGYQKLVTVNLLQKTQTLTVHCLAVLIVLLLQGKLHMLNTRKEKVLLVLESF